MNYYQGRDKRGKYIYEVIFPTANPAAIEKGLADAAEIKFRNVKYLKEFFSLNPHFKTDVDCDILIDKEGYHLFFYPSGDCPFPNIRDN
jgi:hypothetical protein